MASLNTIEQVQSYIASIVDLVYKQGSVTSVLDLNPSMVQKLDNATPFIKIPKILFSGGLMNYDRGDGAKKGGLTLEWEYMKLEQDRGRSFNIDVVENMESLGILLARMVSEYIRLYVTPELDAYRLWTYYDKSENKKEENITDDNAEDALGTAIATLKDAEVPEERLVLFCSNSFYKILKDNVRSRRLVTGEAVKNGITSYDDIPLYTVPKNRFNTKVDILNTGNGGYTTSGKDINFMLMDREAAVQYVKHVNNKIFTPDENIDADAYRWRYRIFHDASSPENKHCGIYVNAVPSA